MTDITSTWAGVLNLDPGHPTIEALAEASSVVICDPDQTILAQDGLSDRVCLVVNGQAKAVHYTANGHEVWISDLNPGDIFGELSVLVSEPSVATVLAVDLVSLVVLPAERFTVLMTNHALFAAWVSRKLCHGVRRSVLYFADLTTQTALSRLHVELVRMGEALNDDEEMFLLGGTPNISELATRIHATRETTSRAMSQLKQRRLVVERDGEWIVLAP